MEWAHILGFLTVAILLVVSPGPNGLLIAKTVPISGKAAGFSNIAGFIVAFFVHGSLSILGISILLVQSAEAFFVFKMAGAAYLFYLGVKALLAARKIEPVTTNMANTANATSTTNTTNTKSDTAAKSAQSLWVGFYEGFLTNALNPKVSVFYLAAFPQFIPTENATSAAYFLVFLHSLLNALWFSALVMLFASARKVAMGARARRWLNSLTGVIFIGFSAKLASLRL